VKVINSIIGMGSVLIVVLTVENMQNVL
ncbi:hypothetical protein, partial [Plasmodium yoelii yoelii]